MLLNTFLNILTFMIIGNRKKFQLIIHIFGASKNIERAIQFFKYTQITFG